MAIRLKPGQLCTINNVVYRAKRRTCGCRGCDLDSFAICPNVVDRRIRGNKVECCLDDVILIRLRNK